MPRWVLHTSSRQGYRCGVEEYPPNGSRSSSRGSAGLRALPPKTQRTQEICQGILDSGQNPFPSRTCVRRSARPQAGEEDSLPRPFTKGKGMRLGQFRWPLRNPYRVAERRAAWTRGVWDRRRRLPIESNPYFPKRIRGPWIYHGQVEANWSAWRRGWLEAGGYCAFLRQKRQKRHKGRT